MGAFRKRRRLTVYGDWGELTQRIMAARMDREPWVSIVRFCIKSVLLVTPKVAIHVYDCIWTTDMGSLS